MKQLKFTIIFILAYVVVCAQESENMDNTFQGTRFVNGQSANLTDPGELKLMIQHRFGDISGGGYEFFGLDQATMRIGFEYGFSNNFNLGIGRSTYLKTYDAFGKLRLLRQNSQSPISLVLTAGGSLPTLKDYFPDGNDKFSDKLSLNTQVHVATRTGNLGFQLSPGYFKTGYLNDISQNLSTFTMGIGGSVSISKKVSANIEYLHPFHTDLTNKSPLSFGVDIDTGGHLFQLVISNSQKIFDQALYTQTAGDWADGNIYFGFNLIREFNLKYYE